MSSATSTSIGTTVPTRTGSGRISVTTAQGKGVSDADFFISPWPFTANDVEYTGRMSIDGSSHTVTITTSSKIGLVVFDGTAGQIVSLGINSTTLSSWSDLNVYKPDGGVLASDGAFGIDANFHMILPVTGTYSILVDPDSASTGSVTLTLSSELNAGTIVVDGPSATATISRVGQRARMTFDGTAGQIVSLGINSTTLSFWSDINVYKPDGGALVSNTSFSTNTNNHIILPVTGTYTILIDPDSASTGSVTLTLSSEIDGGALTINGASAPITISRVGQRARLTFAGTSGQQVTVRVTGNTMGSVAVYLYKPDGTQQTASTSSGGSFNLATQTLSVTGTYTIIVDPTSTNTGSMNISVTSP